MNRKGFTLVELLATIVILGVVGGIATTNVLSSINKSKDKSEDIFVDKLSTYIEQYLDLNRTSLIEKDPPISFKKCKKTKDCDLSESKNYYEVTAREMKLNSGYVKFQTLQNAGVITESDLINPKNKKKCTNSSFEPQIKIYRDSEYVYYYYVDLSNNKCALNDKNKKISTLPKDLKSQVGLS